MAEINEKVVVAGSPASSLDNTLSIQEIWAKCKAKWWWFILSAFVCTILAWLYSKRQPPVYEREELVLVIQNDGSQGPSVDVAAAFERFGLFSQNANKQTELFSITTPSNMMEVTRRLSLNVKYSTPGKWYPITLYGANQPIIVNFPQWPDEASVSLKIDVRPNGKAVIKSVSGPGKDKKPERYENLSIPVNYGTGETVQTPVGPISVSSNPLYSGGAISEPMQVNVSRTSIYNTAMALTGRLKGKVVDDWADVLSLRITDVSTQRAEDILNTIISVYNEDWIRERTRVAEATSRFINDRLNIIEHELGNVDSDISSYKSVNLLPDVQTSASLYMQKANRASEALMELSNRLAMTRYVREFMTKSSNSNSVLPANTGVADMNIETQIAEYNKTLMERNQLLANSSSVNPIVSELDTRLKGMRQALVQSLDNAITALNTQISSFQHEESASTSKIASSPSQARYLLSVERQQKVKESLYLYLLQKREENELSQNYTNNKVRVISQPLGSPGPIAPNTRMNIIIGFVLGLLIPLAYINLKEILNTKVRDRKDVERLKVPFVGELPVAHGPVGRLSRLFKKGEDSKKGILVEKENLNNINEAFRVLRTSLMMMTRRTEFQPASVISVTSAHPGSGKTFISSNLAAALAIKGYRVLLMDLDLRRCSLSEDILGKHNASTAHGLVNYLVGTSQPNQIIHHNINNIEGLDFVPVGPVPPNPSELLEDSRMSELVECFRSEYDYIIFDCPPIDIVADTLIVNPLVDLTLFVIRVGLFDRSSLSMVQELYDQKRYNNLGIVLNATAQSPYGYGYNSHYGYGYGYGKKRYKKKD